MEMDDFDRRPEERVLDVRTHCLASGTLNDNR
jgi:hypothetical protein